MEFQQFGKYTIIKKLTSGGMADIFLALNLSPTGFGRFVVIKKALAKFSNNQEFNDMFKNEAKVACNLKHKNITPIYEFGLEEDQLFLSMEYIAGKNIRQLTQKIKAQKLKMDVPDIVYIIKEMTSGLNYAHNAIDSNTGLPLHVIHRDISPQNIMLSFEGEVKLIDFGIAKISDTNLTRAGHLKGKFSYMSPEHARGEEIDERTDIFCVGIILWELLTEKRLFASKNEMASLKKVRNCEIPSVQKINPNIPTELSNIVMKALSKNKNLRYKTASKLEKDLLLFLNKSYPEYSHYNLITLIKNVYRREIMAEREHLKLFATEFKKYINSLNIEKTFKNEVSINIPERTIVSDKHNLKSNQSSIQTNQASNKENNISKLSTYETFLTDTQKESAGFIAENSTLVKLENLSTQSQKSNLEHISNPMLKIKPLPEKIEHLENLEDVTKTQRSKLLNQQKPLQAMDNSINLTQLNTSNLKLQNTDLQVTHNATNILTTKKHTLFNTSQIYKSEKKERNYVTLIFSGITAILLIGLSTTMYWFFQNEKISLNEKTSIEVIKPEPTSIIKTPRALASQSLKKVFINSKPAGAKIFVNNTFTSKYTPTLLMVKINSSIKIKKDGYFSQNFKLNPNNNRIDVKLIEERPTKSSQKIEFIQ